MRWKMSNGRLILSFRNGVSLALNEEKLKNGAVIEIDSDFLQAELQFEEADWAPVDRDEVRGGTVMRLGGMSLQTISKKRKIDIVSTAEASKKMKSMITTTEGRLVSAVPTEIQGERRATLTATQRRNKNRRIHRMLSKLTTYQNKESAPTAVASTSKESAQKKFKKKKIAPEKPEAGLVPESQIARSRLGEFAV